jgi:hypothetical protein
MKYITVEIRASGEAFEDDRWRDEAARILREAAKRIKGGKAGYLRDANGNSPRQQGLRAADNRLRHQQLANLTTFELSRLATPGG